METKEVIIDQGLDAINKDYKALLITGNIFDLQVEENKIYYRPYYLAQKLFEKGYLVIRYSRSSGLNVYRYTEIKNNSDLQNILNRSGLNKYVGNKNVSPTEVIDIFRAFKLLATKKHNQSVVIIVDYLPHLSSHQTPSIEERIVAETISDISSLPSFRKSGNILLLYSHQESNLSPLFKKLHKISYDYPSLKEYEDLVESLTEKQEFSDITIDKTEIAKASRGLSLKHLSDIFYEAKSGDKIIEKEQIIEEKRNIIENISDNTLTVLSSELTFDDLAGLEVTKSVLNDFAKKLSVQDTSSPRAILLAGPPGTGKSTIVSALANASNFNLVELSDSIKSKWVGESEARLDQALQLIQSLAPVILFIDEIDQVFSNRTGTSNDGGVSSHYLKTLFKFAARDDLRGKICIVGCSNTPQLLDPAMINRFVTVPILEATPNELAAIFPKIEKRIIGEERLDQTNKELIEGCELLYNKGVSPRLLFDIINHTINKYGTDYNEHNILESCMRFRTGGDPLSGAYSSLSAINMTAFEDYLPWTNNPGNYTYPWYLENIVDKLTGIIREIELQKKLNEFAKESKF